MANTTLDLTSVDFDTLKQSFKTYLTSQTIFKDYNFDGSNMSTLLDVMSYNSYLNSFYLNMVASEMFLDSAQKLDSVVSHAKELNYIPQSAKSAVAVVNFTANTDGVANPFVIPKGSIFSGENANGVFNFVTQEIQSYTSANSTYAINGLYLYQGFYNNDSFIVDYTQPSQKYILTNQNIDTSSLTITVSENNGQTNNVFARAETLFNLNSNSSVYFLQAAQNGQYEITFGDGLFGRVPLNGSIVTANYRVTNGPAADGISSFICIQDLATPNGVVGSKVILSTINAVSNSTFSGVSAGGSVQESIDSIRFAAPRYFATQQRAVASDDYSSLVLAKFGGEISDVNVYGGEQLEPKQYGRVVVTVKPNSGTIAPDYLKNEISSYLLDYVALPNRVVMADPDYLYIKIDSTVQYDKTTTTKLPADLLSILKANTIQFSKDHIENFGNDFRYSKFVTHIDNSDPSITSNDTSIKIIKRISPKLNYATTYNIDFNNPSELEELSPGYTKKNPLSDEPMLTSSAFTYVNAAGIEYPLSYIRDDNFGNLIVYSVIKGVFSILNSSIGSINYTTGYVKINKLVTSAYDNHISIYMVPQNKDILASKDKILLIDLNDVKFNIIETKK